MMGTALGRHGPWALVGALGAAALAIVASQRGETINALWIVVAAVCVYLIAYRYYAKFIADKVMRLDPKRVTPAVRHNDGLDYVPTNRGVLFGHHFAAIACSGSWPAWCSPAPCRTSWSCSCRCAGTAGRSAS
jgi:carbon starvation protein